MSLPVILRPEAEDDVVEIYQDLQSIRHGLGSGFLAQLREVLDRIESFPNLHAVIWKDVRAVRLKKFQYVVYYIVLSDRVEILAVIHGARHHSTWQTRV